MFRRSLNLIAPRLQTLNVRQMSTPAKKLSRYVNSETTVVTAAKKGVKQSPLKMKFLVGLIRNRWVPDALAQLKFSAKHRAIDVAKIVNRACAISRIHHDTVPEEMIIKEVYVTKGEARKRMTIMGKGRAGMGYTRESHVVVKVDKLDFEKLIAEAKTAGEKTKWSSRYELVKKLKLPGAVPTPMTRLVPLRRRKLSYAEKMAEEANEA